MLELTLSLTLLANSMPDLEWIKDSHGYVEATVPDTVLYVVNYVGPTIIVPANSGTSVRQQDVYGDPLEDDPEWSAKFTPLHDGDTSFEWSHPSYAVPARWFALGRVDWYLEAGFEVWGLYEHGLATGLQVRRDRDWSRDTPPTVFGKFSLDVPE